MTTFDVQARPISEAHKREHKRNIMLLAVAAFAIVAFLLWRQLSHGQSTDDAQIEGHVVPVSARIDGRIQRVLVRNNHTVAAGQALIELEPTAVTARHELAVAEQASARAALDTARAQLALTERTARATVAQAKGGVLQAGYGLNASNAARKQAESELRMAHERRLRMESDHARALTQLGAAVDVAAGTQPIASPEWGQALESARAHEARAEALLRGATAHRSTSWGGIVAARGRLDQAQGLAEQLEVARGNVALAEAGVAQAEAKLKLANHDAEGTVIRAAGAGTVTRLTAEVGQTASADRPLLAIVSDEECWVSATFKERQLSKLRPDQPAEVSVDALGARPFKARVESLSGAGPVLLRLLDKDEARKLRPGMSADVRVLE
jgi:membrane fusion protein (multidrug efflux system)